MVRSSQSRLSPPSVQSLRQNLAGTFQVSWSLLAVFEVATSSSETKEPFELISTLISHDRTPSLSITPATLLPFFWLINRGGYCSPRPNKMATDQLKLHWQPKNSTSVHIDSKLLVFGSQSNTFIDTIIQQSRLSIALSVLLLLLVPFRAYTLRRCASKTIPNYMFGLKIVRPDNAL